MCFQLGNSEYGMILTGNNPWPVPATLVIVNETDKPTKRTYAADGQKTNESPESLWVDLDEIEESMTPSIWAEEKHDKLSVPIHMAERKTYKSILASWGVKGTTQDSLLPAVSQVYAEQANECPFISLMIDADENEDDVSHESDKIEGSRSPSISAIEEHGELAVSCTPVLEKEDDHQSMPTHVAERKTWWSMLASWVMGGNTHELLVPVLSQMVHGETSEESDDKSDKTFDESDESDKSDGSMIHSLAEKNRGELATSTSLTEKLLSSKTLSLVNSDETRLLSKSVKLSSKSNSSVLLEEDDHSTPIPVVRVCRHKNYAFKLITDSCVCSNVRMMVSVSISQLHRRYDVLNFQYRCL